MVDQFLLVVLKVGPDFFVQALWNHHEHEWVHHLSVARLGLPEKVDVLAVVRVYPNYSFLQVPFGVEVSKQFFKFEVCVLIILHREFVCCVDSDREKFSLGFVGFKEFLRVLKAALNYVFLE